MKRNIFFLFLFLEFLLEADLKAQMRVHVIDVGQGCATLIEFPCAAILIDAGGENNTFYSSRDSLKAYLDNFFNERRDLHNTFQCVYITHPHIDHTLGVPTMMQSPYIIKNIVTDGLEEGSGKQGQIQLHRAVQEAEESADMGDDIGFEAVTVEELSGQGITNNVIDPVACEGIDPLIKVLWGTSSTDPGWGATDFNDENNHSLVIKVEYGTSSLLITGDLEEKAQHDLVAKYAGTGVLKADVYLVGHHGSKNGTTPELINSISPHMALIGVGDPSRRIPWTAWAYGHPNKGILDMLQQTISASRAPIQVKVGTGARTFVNYSITKAIYATAWDKSIVLEADKNGNWQKVEKARTTLVPAFVNINTASLSDLETLPGIGRTRAESIIENRTIRGQFTSLEALRSVPGIGPATLQLIKPYVKF